MKERSSRIIGCELNFNLTVAGEHYYVFKNTPKVPGDDKLSSGSFTTVLWPLEHNYSTLVLPITAVTTDQQHTFVIRIENDKVEWVTVQTGHTVNGEVEVFGELKAGDNVVEAATEAIHSGDKVQISRTEAP